MRAKISELSSVTGLPAQICWPRPELRDRLRFTVVSSIFILQAFAWARIVGSVCIPTQSTKLILGGPAAASSRRAATRTGHPAAPQRTPRCCTPDRCVKSRHTK
eukprot:COSAG01_NODE_480_length_16473_cov_655.154208_19_plen_104_part_00